MSGKRQPGLTAATILLLFLAAGMAYAQGPEGVFSPQAALGTAFTYQGQLLQGGAPVNDRCDLRFMLYNSESGGAQIGSAVEKVGLVVSEGLFTVQLDFGADAFNGEARWLEIKLRCPAGSGDYALLTPRQSLTATPYALYALKVGLHNHLGQTWSGSDNPLVISGSFSKSPNNAPLVLSNSHASSDGLRVMSAGRDGVYVGSADYGLHVGSVDKDGVYVSQADGDGFSVASAGDDGVYVYSASDDGVHVQKAGSPSATSASTDHNGFEVAGAQGNGVHVGRADEAGVYVDSAGSDGVYVDSAGSDGVYVYSAGSPSGWAQTPSSNGFEVAGAEGNGLFVGNAGDNGVYVESAVNNGVSVNATAGDGLYVHSAGDDGVHVEWTVGDGLHVFSAGDDGVYVESADDDGVQVRWAGGSGVDVRAGGDGVEVSADLDGVYVAAGWDGVAVNSAGDNGLSVHWAEGDGLHVRSVGDDGVYVGSVGEYGGYFNGVVYATFFAGPGVSSQIDHPLDPENQYLYHSLVGSPDMMNIYNGNVTLDAAGEAWVELPAWFEALNQDFRYQLTPIGAPGPNLYVAEEVKDNRFKIAGGAAGMRVSWQLTGIRHDPYAEASRVPVEKDKPPQERGTYLAPEAYGLPETMGLASKKSQTSEYRAADSER